MKIAMILMSMIVSGSAFAQHAPATPPTDQGAMHEEKAPEAAPAKKEHKKKNKKAKK